MGLDKKKNPPEYTENVDETTHTSVQLTSPM